jgi:hypothetical protein
MALLSYHQQASPRLKIDLNQLFPGRFCCGVTSTLFFKACWVNEKIRYFSCF